MLEPLNVAKKLVAMAEEETKMDPQPKLETVLTFSEKMGEQGLQLSQVRKFVDK